MFFKKKQHFSEDNLEQVIEACISGNKGAQNALIRIFFGYVKSICLRYSSSEAEAEEVINDSFLKMFNNLAKYDQSKPFKAWLRAISVNTAIDHYRRNKKELQQVSLEHMKLISPQEDVISKLTANEILAFVQKLSPAYRTVFSLHVIDGYNHREIAELLGIKEGTSKSNLQDARIKLQEMILNEHPALYYAYSMKVNTINEN